MTNSEIVARFMKKLMFEDAEENEHRYYFFIKGTPVVLQRARHVGRVVYTPAKSQRAKNYIRDSVLHEQHRQTGYKPPQYPHGGEVLMMLTFFFRRPKRGAKDKKYRIGSGDLSNFLKLIEDALQGIIYRDDRQIVSVETCQLYTDGTEGTAIGIIAYD